MPDHFVNSAADLQLAVSLQQGNQQSLADVYDKYAPALAGIISKMVNETSLAEKILHISFVAAWDRIGTFHPSNSSFFNWLINITRQTAFATIKSQQQTNPTGKVPVYKAPINRSLQQAAFDLVYYNGLCYAEAATALETTVAAVKADIHLTLNNIKQQTAE
jgi:RNA polymerase sigma-70 factor (ECF subfamily)